MRHFFPAILALACCLFNACHTPNIAPGSPAGNLAAGNQVTLFNDAGQNYDFSVELAITDREHATGLMNRRELGADQGMLFVFDDDSLRTFWMKNTLISLDMIFISSSLEIVGIVHEADPLTLTARSVGRPSRYVLEINGGTCKRLGILPGSTIKLNLQ